MILLLAHPSEGCVGAMRDSDNIYVETSGTMPGFIEMATRIDENRVLFGSGIPYFRVPTQVAIIEAAEIPDKSKRKVYSGNFERLFRQ